MIQGLSGPGFWARRVLDVRWLPALLALALSFAVGPVEAQKASARETPSSKSPARAGKPDPAAKAQGTAKRTSARKGAAAKAPVRSARAPARPSMGTREGLRAVDDPLDLKSSVALVVDQDTDQVLFSKNANAVLPIASITKLMTAMVVLDEQLPLDETLTITKADIDFGKGSGSRLLPGTELSRGEMLHLALMASENRAANALGRHFPGGMPAFVEAMNRKAQVLGLTSPRYVEPTGLSSDNRSNAHDLTLLVKAAYDQPLIRELSTSLDKSVQVGKRRVVFRNTNGLVRSQTWDIGLQKTGYISEAGRCVVMQAELAGRKLVMVLLDSAGRQARIVDAERLRRWINSAVPTQVGGLLSDLSR